MAIAALIAMLYVYLFVAKLLNRYLQYHVRNLANAREKLFAVLPELKSGMAAPCHINRKDMTLDIDEGYAEKIGLPHSHWTAAMFRESCNPDSLDVFDKWVGQYSGLTNPVCRRLRFHLSGDGGKTFHWWEVIYILSEKTSKDMYFPGLLVNIDNVIKLEGAIDDARNTVYETELKQTFFASINHDLRTPLNAIAGFANLLKDQYDDLSEEDRQSFADIVQSNGDALMQLIADINDVDCNDVGKMRFKLRNKSVSELVNVIYLTNKVICPSHLAFLLENDAKHNDVQIFVDTKRVEQVINNFLSNAFKFTQAGYIKVGWKYLDDTDEVELFVTDTGIGIKKENFENLFQQFFKIHEHAHGTGLGLNICKTIVEKQSGTIGMDSEYGKGSTFYCRFKVAA